MKPNTKGLIAVVAVLSIFAIVGMFFMLRDTSTEVTYTKFVQMMEENKVEEVNVHNDVVTFTTGEKKNNRIVTYKVYVQQSNSTFVVTRADGETLEFKSLAAYVTYHNANNPAEAKDIVLTFNDRNAGSIWSNVIPIVGFVFLVVLAIILFRSMGGANRQALNFGKSRANSQSNVKVRFCGRCGRGGGEGRT